MVASTLGSKNFENKYYFTVTIKSV